MTWFEFPSLTLTQTSPNSYSSIRAPPRHCLLSGALPDPCIWAASVLDVDQSPRHVVWLLSHACHVCPPQGQAQV